MKIKKLVILSLLCLQIRIFQASAVGMNLDAAINTVTEFGYSTPVASMESSTDTNQCTTSRESKLNESDFCTYFKANMIHNGPLSQVAIVNDSDLYEHLSKLPTVKIYSSDSDIDQFVFDNCIKKFVSAIKRENFKAGYRNNIQDMISVVDILNLMKESQGYSTNHMQALCNGEYTSSQGFMPLHFAIKHHRYIDMIKILIEHGADVNAVDKDNHTPLMLVFERLKFSGNGTNMFELLLQHGADINKKSVYNEQRKEYVTLLDAAADLCFCKGDHRLFIFLLEHGADVNAALPLTKSKLMRSRFCNLSQQKSEK